MFTDSINKKIIPYASRSKDEEAALKYEGYLSKFKIIEGNFFNVILN